MGTVEVELGLKKMAGCEQKLDGCRREEEEEGGRDEGEEEGEETRAG
jgi:hypothetical protein